MSNTKSIMSKESWWNTAVTQPCLLRRSFQLPVMSKGWESCRTQAVQGTSARSRRAGCWLPSSLTASKAAPLFGYDWRCWMLFVCSAAGGCVSSAGQRGQRAENCLTHQHRKEQDCLYGLLETPISRTPPVKTAHRHPWLELIPLPSLGPASPCSCYP